MIGDQYGRDNPCVLPAQTRISLEGPRSTECYFTTKYVHRLYGYQPDYEMSEWKSSQV